MLCITAFKQGEHGGNKLVVNSNGEGSLEYTGQTERYKLCVVGDIECGKTSLLNALVKSDFDVSTRMQWYMFPVTDSEFLTSSF